MTPLVLVHGTFGRSQPWHLPGSEFRREAEAQGYTVYDCLWSGILAGVPTMLPGDPLESEIGADTGMLLPWLDAGEKLALDILQRIRDGADISLDPAHPNLVLLTHSHGLQRGVFFICKSFIPVKTFVSISGPIRRDMQRARRKALGSISRWIQFADSSGQDRTIVEGEMFDGAVGAHFDLPEGETITTPGSGHSGLLNDAGLRARFNFWQQLAA